MQATGHTAFREDVHLTAQRIFGSIATELQLVEEEFERQARSNIQVIAYIGEYLRRSGGKRVRPALTILANHAVGGDGANASSIRMATVMEFLHTATLVHDDVIDNSATRRNRGTLARDSGHSHRRDAQDDRRRIVAVDFAWTHGRFGRAVLRCHRAQDRLLVQRVL
jgi:geranylgeranyl pyrophosphate synthase